MSSRNGVTRYASLLLLGLSLVACGGGEEGAEPAEEPAGEPAAAPAPAAPAPAAGGAGGDVAMGQQLFHGQGICYTCHGQDGIGTALAPNLTDDTWLNITPGGDMQASIANVIRTGVPTPVQHPAPMPPMGGAQLDDQQVNALAAYVASL